jgi:molybdopterin adenylyltransferase
MNLPETLEVLIITLSDRAYSGEYDDQSGPLVREKLAAWFLHTGLKYNIIQTIIPDDSPTLKKLLKSAGESYNIIITTGGTGIGPRDITVETVRPMLSKEIPGIMEYIRIKYGQEKPNALLSRGVAGISGKALVYTLPGSPRAVEEYLNEILKTLQHTILMQYGVDSHHKSQ